MNEPLLAGLRVLDLSRVIAGPYAGQVLAELGAEVIKVEPPSGDPARQIGPHVAGLSLYFAAVNTYKRGIVLDLADASDRAVLDELLERSDVLIENFRPDALERFGLDRPRLATRFPKLNVISVTGYSRDSSRRLLPAFDLVMQAEAGIMSVTGEPGRPPVRAGVPVSDLAAGMWAALAAVSAYTAGRRDGLGRHLEVPLFDASLGLLSYMATAALDKDNNPEAVGSGHHSTAPYGAYPTADGWIVIAVLGDKFWQRLVSALELDVGHLGPSLASATGRVQHRQKVDELIATALHCRPTADAEDLLSRHEIPYGRVATVLDALRSGYVQDRGLVGHMPIDGGAYQVVRGPLGAASRRPAPRLGEHTKEVLRELGIGGGSASDHLGR